MAALAPHHQALAAPSYPLQHQGALAECAFPPQQLGVPPAHRPPLPSGPQSAQQHSQAHRNGPHSGLTHGLQLQAAGAAGGGIPAGTSVAGPVLAPAPAAHVPCYPGQPVPCPPGNSWQMYAQAMQTQAAAAAGGTYGLPAAHAEAAAAPAAAPWPTLAPHAGCYQLFHPSQGAVHPAAAAALHPAGMQQQQLAAAAAPADAGASRRRTRRRPTARRSLLNLFDAAAASEEGCDLSEDSDSESCRPRWGPTGSLPF